MVTFVTVEPVLIHYQLKFIFYIEDYYLCCTVTDFDECFHHCCIIHCSKSPLFFTCSSLHPYPPLSNPWQPLFCCLYKSFILSRMLCIQNHTVWSLSRLVSFIQQYAFKVPSHLFIACQLILFLSLNPWWLGKESTCQCRRHGFDPQVGKIPWRRKWQPTPVFLLGNPMDRGAWWAIVLGVAKELDRTL